VDLFQLGWNETPFEGSGANFHDLVLLEYPYAPPPDRSAVWRELADKYLTVAKPLRPVAYLHADWFVQAVLRQPLSNNLLYGRKKALPDGLDKMSERKQQGQPLQRLIVPLDGLSYLQHNLEDQPMRVAFEAINAETNKVETVFPPKGKLVVRLKNLGTKSIYFHIVFTTESGTQGDDVAEEPLGPGKTYLYPPASADPPYLPLDPEPGKDHISLFASEDRLPNRILLKGIMLNGKKGMVDRVLHDFYPLGGTAQAFDTNRLLKKTIEVETSAGTK
jgi:hypothetical protein